LINASNTHLLYIFIKMNMINFSGNQYHLTRLTLSLSLYSQFFEKSFYKFFKRMHVSNLGIMSINLTKSLFGKVYSDLNLQISKKVKPSKLSYSSKHNVNYLQPITIISFSFHKKTYDTLMIFIISILVNNYNTPYNFFKLYHGFLLKPNNFNVYPFLNLFYFKLKQF